jgi:surfeit locus 1 family protein
MLTVAGRRLTRLDLAFLLAAACMGALFTRLGVWQINRLHERRARNALALMRLDRPPHNLADLPRDTGAARFMMVRLVGAYDFDHELILVNRSREGAPGVQFITPMRPTPMSDTAVLVDRGWAYAPDAETVDPRLWRERVDVNATGYVVELPSIGVGAASLQGHPREARWLDPAAIARMTGYPVAPFLIVLSGDTTADSARIPIRLSGPALDDGPHLNYAIQWFAFAALAFVGAPVAVFRSRAPAIAS